jgi:uncharacterized membrane protein YkgB
MSEKTTKIDEEIKQSSTYRKIDRKIVSWMKANGLFVLRISIGIIFLWFGALKFFPDLSPAEDLAEATISTITFGLLSSSQINTGLAIWEVLIGLGLLFGKFMRLTLLLLFLQLPGTFLPVFLFPDQVFESVPFVPTLEGQYIFKNLVLIGAGLVMGGFLEKRPTGGLKDQPTK